MKTEWVEVALGRMPLKVPVIGDKATTLRVADRVNARLAEIEKQSDRVDSHAFALLAAMTFAAEIEELERQVAQEARRAEEECAAYGRELLTELDALSSALRTSPKKNIRPFRKA